MNATKRKFNALLSSIGSRPPSDSKDKDNVHQCERSSTRKEFLSKRRRVTDSFSTPSQKKCEPLGSRSLLSHKASLDSLKSQSMSAKPTMTVYAPWDRDEFLNRLKTFSNISHWTPKPSAVNEVEWAKRGWICLKFERVRCCSCNVEIVVKLNKKDRDGKEEPVYVAHAIEKAIVEKYIDLIVTSHKTNCLWRKRGCDDSIFRLPLNQPFNMIKNLKRRYEEIKLSREKLPYIYNLKTPDEFDLEETIRYLPKDFFTDEKSDIGISLTSFEKVAFTLAVFGWQSYHHERLGLQSNSISCHVCFRILGLWLFKSKETNESGEEVRGATMNCLDVVQQHREYCPWRNPISQNGPLGSKLSPPELMSGWKMVLRVLKSEYSLLNQSSDRYQRLSHDFLEKSGRDKKDKEIRTRLNRVKSLFIHHSVRKASKNDASKSIISRT